MGCKHIHTLEKVLERLCTMREVEIGEWKREKYQRQSGFTLPSSNRWVLNGKAKTTKGEYSDQKERLLRISILVGEKAHYLRLQSCSIPFPF